MKNTCGIIIYHQISNSILLGRATGFDNAWSIPKGLQEIGETTLDAAIREVQEESNISKEFILKHHLIPLTPQNYNSKKKRLHTYLMIIDEIPNDIKCISYFTDSFGNVKPEFDLLKWVEVDELLDGKTYNIHYTLLEAIIESIKI